MKALGIEGLFEPNLVLLGAKKLGDEWVSQA
jgi:type III pantothenate kinase